MTPAELVSTAESGAERTIVLAKTRVVIGRDGDVCDVVLSQPFISKRHAELELADAATTLRDLGSKYGTFVNGAAVREHVLADGDRVGFGPEGLIAFTFRAGRIRPAPVDGLPSTDTNGVRSIDVGAASHSAGLPGTERAAAHEPRDGGTFTALTTVRAGSTTVLNIGRAPDNEIVLSAAGVSRHHARLTLAPDAPPVLADLASTNGTYVNGELLREPRALEPDDLILIAGSLFKVDGLTIRQIDLGESRLCAVGLSKSIKGEPVIDEISLAVLPGEFVGLMGASGSGKSTLMDALDGLRPAPVGSVFLGELDLYHDFAAVRRSIGHVPQHDILHDELSVERTLLYAARLRLPETTPRASIAKVVADVIATVNLQHRRDTPFRSLSGGEQKRLSIAIELLTKPHFLFLDEPTSPLDPETTEDLMGRLRALANEGRIVVMITHKFEKFGSMDKVAFLTQGGRLAFYGPPGAALAYFRCAEPGDIFRRMHSQLPDDLQRRFAASPDYDRYVQSRVRESRAVVQDAHRTNAAVPAARPRSSPYAAFAQWCTLTQRLFEIKLKDRRNTALLVLQAPLIAMVLVLISGGVRNDPKTLFIAAVIAVWFGANNAIREIVGEFPIYQRERRFSLQIPPYVLSKFTVLSAIGLAQSVTFTAILAAFGLVSPHDFAPLWLVLFLTTLGGVSMALFFSALVSSTEKAISILPLILIPQLLLSGFLKPIDTVYVDHAAAKPVSAAAYDRAMAAPADPMHPRTIEKRDGLGPARPVSALLMARWSVDALAHIVSLDDAETRDRMAGQLSMAAYATVLDGESGPAIADAYGRRIAFDLTLLAVFTVVPLGLTMVALKRRDVL